MGAIAECATPRRTRRALQLLDVPSSSFYAWRIREARTAPTPRQARHQAVTDRIVAHHTASRGMLGRRPMRQLLRQDGVACSPGLVHRIMAEQQLQARRHRRYRRIRTHGRPDGIENLLARADGAGTRQERCDFTSTAPGTRTVGDMTYVRTGEGWAFLFTVLDLATRAVIGWSLQARAEAEGAVAALAMAKARGRLRDGAIFHSDHGGQYTAAAMARWCRDHDVRQSMGRTGVCWDNAVAEAFFATLKGDLGIGRHHGYATRTEARNEIVRYIEGWYNRRRPHRHTAGAPPLVAWDRARWPAPILHQT